MIFKAGAGSAEVRFPQEIFPIEGFVGVHDYPHIRVLVMESGIRIAIVATELVNVSGEGLENIRSIVSRITGTEPSHVLVHITHAITTPHIPQDPDAVNNGPRNEHMDEIPPELARRQRALFLAVLEKAATEAAAQAAASFTDARLGYGFGESNVNINRDIETPVGWWVNLNADGYSDKQLSILRIETASGKPLAIVVNYALKPCAIDNSQRKEGKRLISSDVPGLASTLVEERTGAICLYIMGAAGDQVPRKMALLDEVDPDGRVTSIDLGVEYGLKIVDALGHELAEDICSAVERISCSSCSSKIKAASTKAVCTAKQRMEMIPRREATYIPGHDICVKSEIFALGEVAFVSAKPEINSVTGAELKERSPFKATFLLTMTNGEMKYMPDRASYEHISWEAQSSMLMPGSAEAWLDAVVEALHKL